MSQLCGTMAPGNWASYLPVCQLPKGHSSEFHVAQPRADGFQCRWRGSGRFVQWAGRYVPADPAATPDAPRLADRGVTGDDPGRSPIPPAGPGSSSPAAEYRLTFGVHYSREPHPRGEWIHPDGWVTVVAASRGEARQVVVDLFGRYWSDLYDPESFNPAYFPRGELLRVVVPAGLIETEEHR